MKNIFAVLATPFVWLGKEIESATVWVPKVIQIIKDGRAEAAILQPEVIATFQSTQTLAKLCVTDFKDDLPALEQIIADIAELGGAGKLDPTKYAQIVAAINNFLTVSHNTEFGPLWLALKDVIQKFESLGTEAKKAIETLDADIKTA